MINRFFTFLIFLPLLLSAEPSISTIKAAVEAKPALLETPQAKAAMAEKGITATQVKEKLAQDASTSEVSTEVATVVNTIDENSSEEPTSESVKRGDFQKDMSPFAYQKDVSFKERQQNLEQSKLSRYSMRFFSNKNEIDSASLPTPDDYIVTTGDVIGVQVYGDKNQEYSLEVKNDGTVNLAFVGPVKVGGMDFKSAKEYLRSSLKTHYTTSEFNINMSKYSTIQVTLIGKVKHPGLYNLSSFATIKDLLIVAKGVEADASVREIIVKRNSKIIAQLDFYKLLFDGNELDRILLKHGDIVVINKAEKLVGIDGYVGDSAIFELTNNEKLDKLIEYAGGMRPNASKENIKISRFSNNSKLETFDVSYKDAKQFDLMNGDKVYIYPLDASAQNSVNIYGNIIRPGNYRIDKDLTLNSLLKKEVQQGLKKFFLPNTYFEYAVVKRYTDNLTYSTTSFNLLHVLDGSKKVELKPQDQVFIFSRNDIYANAYITTKGSALIKPGKLQYYEGMTIQDAINASGVASTRSDLNVTTSAQDDINASKVALRIDDKIRVTTYNTDDFMPKTTFYSLEKEAKNIVINPYDEIEVYDFYALNALENITISGEVTNPNEFFYEKGMSLKMLLDMSGGFTNKAYTKEAEIVRYSVDANQERKSEVVKVDLEANNLETLILYPNDEVKIFRIPNWNDKRKITLKGAVKFPGTYVFQSGEKLSHVLERAGGFTENAFVDGAIFTRESIRQNQVEQYNSSLARIKQQLAIFNAMPANAKTSPTALQGSNALNEVIEEAKKYQPIGRISVDLDANLTEFKTSEFDLVLQDNDTIVIPEMIDTVTVFGEVFNPSSFIYNSELDTEGYVSLASGYSRAADTDRVYVIHADGTSEPINSGLFGGEITIKKGDTIVVPIYIQEYNSLEIWDSVSKILSNFALTAAAANSLGITK
ncbi:MAG: SLBB domain-containing protein [Sulfurimonas sp.]|nr:SLBB domain-containing protein [Sulfurimonas sp.]